MTLELQPGRYIVAVSGGVDSVVLLHALVRLRSVELIIAHFDHGIRPDSAQDAVFVATLARQYGLPYVTARVELGTGASEASARRARYGFLHQVQKQHDARAIITAHHQDDVLETAILNVIRGTGRRGLTSLQSRPGLLRPLLETPKTDVVAYAIQQKLSWHEDTTNHDDKYTRNYIRHHLLVRFDTNARQRLLGLLKQLRSINDRLDHELAVCMPAASELSRTWFLQLPHDVSREVMATFLRNNNVADFDRKTIERLVLQAKTKTPGKRLDVLHGHQLVIELEAIKIAYDAVPYISN